MCFCARINACATNESCFRNCWFLMYIQINLEKHIYLYRYGSWRTWLLSWPQMNMNLDNAHHGNSPMYSPTFSFFFFSAEFSWFGSPAINSCSKIVQLRLWAIILLIIIIVYLPAFSPVFPSLSPGPFIGFDCVWTSKNCSDVCSRCVLLMVGGRWPRSLAW